MNWTLQVSVPRHDRYDIVVGRDLLRGGEWRRQLHDDQATTRAWVVTDATVASVHQDRLVALDPSGDWVAGTLVLAPGERTKSLTAWTGVLDWLSDQRVQRRDLLLAVGGSVVSDLVGFVAATYMRGIKYANVPTTLLSQVDGAMGGKVAVNTESAKNLVGSFHHPSFVLTDTAFLSTLSRAELANGLAEAIKTFVIESSAWLAYLESSVDRCLGGDLDTLTRVVRACAAIKMHLLKDDPYEADLRRVLNLGHTLGHPIETSHAYEEIRHGEAVAIGMAAATRIGVRRGITAPAVGKRLLALLVSAELPTNIDASAVPEVLERVDMVAAIRGGSTRFVIPIELGGRMAIVDDVSPEEMATALVGSEA